MKRIKTIPRNNWQQAVEAIGFWFHTTDNPYWDESVYYEFSLQEISMIEKKTAELWQMCLEAVQYVIDHRLYARFRIPGFIIPLIEQSWEEDHPSIYGRFDLCLKDGQLKLLEFNADTPTSLYEMAVVQWFWLRDFDPSADQFNSAHEKLIAYWKHLAEHLKPGPIHFSCVKGSTEDLTTIEYLRDCAMQAGLETRELFMEDMGWQINKHKFVDLSAKPIHNIFKLYPWEYMLTDPFGRELLQAANDLFWMEPAWKMILSNKAILPLLYQLFSENDLILQAADTTSAFNDFVRKPVFGREGSNVAISSNGRILEEKGGEYGSEGFIYQQLFSLPAFDGKYPLIGSWIIGGEPAGIGIRESDSLITDNTSRFVPHLIK